MLYHWGLGFVMVAWLSIDYPEFWCAQNNRKMGRCRKEEAASW
jgi:hypothetical protein